MGALLSVVLSSVCVILFSAIVTTWLGLISVDEERTAVLIIWLFFVLFSGYIVARKSDPFSWKTVFVMAALVELYVVVRVFRQGSPVSDTTPHWRRTAALVLTMPAAFIGACIYFARASKSSSGNQ